MKKLRLHQEFHEAGRFGQIAPSGSEVTCPKAGSTTRAPCVRVSVAPRVTVPAADVAISTAFGACSLQRFMVRTDEVMASTKVG